MLHRSRDSSARPPAPVYMTPKQMGDYLNDLRTNRVARPTGARPPPSSFHSVRKSVSNLTVDDDGSNPEDAGDEFGSTLPRCGSSQSFRRKASASSFAGSNAGRPLARQPTEADGLEDAENEAPIVPYKESPRRAKERQEARFLRIALEDMDLKEERRVHSAAQDEASELVWRHQNPDAPYKYPESTSRRNHRRIKSRGSAAEMGLDQTSFKVRSRDSSSNYSRSTSGRSASGSSRVASGSSTGSNHSQLMSSEESAMDEVAGTKLNPRKRAVQFATSVPENSDGGDEEEVVRRRKLLRSEKTSTSGTSSFVNTARKASNTVPHHFRNPFSRVKDARASLAQKGVGETHDLNRFDRVEIQKNPPTQSRNPGYTTNSVESVQKESPSTAATEEIKMKDGKEIRGDDIRKATSMSLKDRSSNLPTPSMVSDSPGRPIVSFNQSWAPKEIKLTENISQEPPSSRKPQPPGKTSAWTETNQQSNRGRFSPERSPVKAAPPPPQQPLPTINFPDENDAPSMQAHRVPSIPSIAVSPASPIKQPKMSMAPPSISVSAASAPPPPTRPPSISVSEVPSISIGGDDGDSYGPPATVPPARPLPTPGNHSRPQPRHKANNSFSGQSHWTPTSARSTVLCSSCALPISGRIVTAAGARFHPECFRCYYCSEALECVAFYPEPDTFRDERLERISARRNGEYVEEKPGCTDADDGDDSLRFYCHLDFHEFFSPRCKSCKTPIEGEVVVACGAEWHVGHFFCAQCGDPFDAQKPFVEKDGYAWCINCHTNRYSTKCKKCRKPVIDTVIRALDAEWHEDCFCCSECNGKFKDGRYFLRPDSADPFCPSCEERRIKAHC